MTETRRPTRDLFDQLDAKLVVLDAAKAAHDQAADALKRASAAYETAIAEVEAIQKETSDAIASRLTRNRVAS